jgi:hypothetical protein
MLREKSVIRGKVTATVFDKNGKVKLWSPELDLELMKRKIKKSNIFMTAIIVLKIIIYIIIDSINPRQMISVDHNIVTDQGDALVADIMSQTPARQKLDNTHAYIEVGTAYSATGAKAQTGCHTPTGSREGMDATYPKQKGTWGNSNDNVVQYMATFEAGDLDATINEAALMNASTSGDCLAYGHISPDAVVSSSDTLAVTWEITFLGA